MFVANYGSGSVSVISDSTKAVVATIPVGKGPVGVAHDPIKDSIYVSNVVQGTISIISVGVAFIPTSELFLYVGVAVAAVAAVVALLVILRRRGRSPPPSG